MKYADQILLALLLRVGQYNQSVFDDFNNGKPVEWTNEKTGRKFIFQKDKPIEMQAEIPVQ